MKVSESFPGTYLKCADLRGREAKVSIAQVQNEDIGGDQKPVAYFIGKERGLVLNKTNATTIAETHGDDMETWYGKEIVLYPARTDFQGKTVDCIRCRVDAPVAAPPKAPKVKPSTQAAEQFESETPPEDIPF